MLAASALLAPAYAAAPAPAAAAACASSSSLDRSTARAMRLELRCRMNAVRAQHGLGRLHPNGALARAARFHAHDMVRRRYVSHYSRAGRGPANRVAGAGYMRGTRRWWVGENIAWTSGGRDLDWIVGAWLRSPSHRHILLSARFDELGIGVAKSSPQGDGRGLTVVVDFGFRLADRRARRKQQVVKQRGGESSFEHGPVHGL